MSQWQRPESIEQRALVKRLFLHKWTKELPWFAVPNGSNKSINQAKLFKAEGLRAGVPDLIFPVMGKRHFGLAIEMKRPDGKGKVSKTQAEFHARLAANTWRVAVCDTAEEAWEAIMDHLDVPPKER